MTRVHPVEYVNSFLLYLGGFQYFENSSNQNNWPNGGVSTRVTRTSVPSHDGAYNGIWTWLGDRAEWGDVDGWRQGDYGSSWADAFWGNGGWEAWHNSNGGTKPDYTWHPWLNDMQQFDDFCVTGAEYTVEVGYYTISTGYRNTGTFIYDDQRPTIAYNIPANIKTPITVTGTAHDTYSGVHSVKYRLHYITGGTEYYWNGSGWTTQNPKINADSASNLDTPNATVNWSINLPPLPINNKRYYLKVYAYDQAGNYKTKTDNFYYDATPPTVTLEEPIPSSDNYCRFIYSTVAYLNGDLWDKTISGRVVDNAGGSGVGSVNLTISKDGQSFDGMNWVPWHPTISIPLALSNGDFSYTLSNVFFNSASDGEIDIQIHASDLAGNSDTDGTNLILDREPPSSTIDPPNVPIIYFSTPPTEISGTAADVHSGIQSVKLLISRVRGNTTQYWGYAQPADPLPTWNNNQNWVNASVDNSGNWTYPTNAFANSQPDDVFYVTSKAIDRAGIEEDQGPTKELRYDDSAPILSFYDPTPTTHFNQYNGFEYVAIKAIDETSPVVAVIFKAQRDSEFFDWSVYEEWTVTPHDIFTTANYNVGDDVYVVDLPPGFFDGIEDGNSFTFTATAINQANITNEIVLGPIIYDTSYPTNPSILDTEVQWFNSNSIDLTNLFDFSTAIDPVPAGKAASGLQKYNLDVVGPDGSESYNVPASDPSSVALNMSAEGIYALDIKSVDWAGNANPDFTTTQIGYDITPPQSVNISNPANGSTIHTVVPTVTWTPASDVQPGSGFDHYEIYLDGNLMGSTTELSLEIPAGNMGNGSHTISVLAYDKAGNHSDTSSTFTAEDIAPPTIEITSPEDGAAVNTAQVNIQGLVTDDYLVTKVEIKSTASPSYTTLFSGSQNEYPVDQNVNLTPGRENIITIHAIDSSNNDTTTSISVICDQDPPSAFELISPEDNSWAPAKPNYSWEKSTDALSGIAGYDLYVDNNKINAELIIGESFTATSALTNGTHEYYVIARDKAGNQKQSVTFSFEVDSDAPTAFNLTAPAEGAYIESAFDVIWTESSDQTSGLAAYDIYIDGEKLTETTDTLYHIDEVPADGSHTLYILARDVAGNTTQSNTVNFTTNVNAPAIILYVNDELAEDGDRISTLPRIKAQISDDSGINQSSIKITIDNYIHSTFDLQATQTKGASIVTAYDISKDNIKLDAGKHSIKIEVKDIHGKTTVLEVKDLDVLGYAAIEQRPMNYPNPFRPSYGDTTRINYTLTDDADIKIMLYDLAGRQVNSIFCAAGTEGGRAGANNVPWDGKNISGNILGNGVYVYIIVNKGSVLNSGEIAIHE
jgi:hypothetical protein